MKEEERPLSGRIVSGLLPMDDVAICYFSGDEEEPSQISKLFLAIAEREFVSKGAWMIDGCTLTVPDGTQFHAGRYRGQFTGEFLQLFEANAKQFGRQFAQVDPDLEALLLPDGTATPIEDCEVTFY